MSSPRPVHADSPAPVFSASSGGRNHPRPIASMLLLLTLLVVPTGLIAGPASAQAEFPSPVVAPVLPEEDTPAPLAVTSLRADDEAEASTLVVEFRDPFVLPDVFRYRIALHVGDPTGESERISLLAESGEAVGVHERGGGNSWESIGETEVEYDAGVARIGLPDDFTTEPTDLAWIEVTLVEADGGAAQRFVTPLFPATDLLFPVGPQLSAASLAWGSINKQPPDPAVASGVPPTVQLEDGVVVVSYSSALPTTVGDAPVTNVVDVVRIAPDFEGRGIAPYLVAIDHGRGTISLLDGTQELPVEVATDGSWITDGLPEGGIKAGDVIRFQLADALAAFDLPPESTQAALGVARSVTLDEGRVVRADGPLGTTEWLATTATAPPASTPTAPSSSPPGSDAPTATSAPASTSDSSQSLLPLIAVVCIVVLLGAAAWLTLRWFEHRRHSVVTGGASTSAAQPAVVVATAVERERLEAFTSELFGAVAAGPVPPQTTGASLFSDAMAAEAAPDEATAPPAPVAGEATAVEQIDETVTAPAETETPTEIEMPAETETADASEPPPPAVPPVGDGNESSINTPRSEGVPMRASGNPAADLLTDLLNAEVDRLGTPAASQPGDADTDGDEPLPGSGSNGLPSRSRK